MWLSATPPSANVIHRQIYRTSSVTLTWSRDTASIPDEVWRTSRLSSSMVVNQQMNSESFYRRMHYICSLLRHNFTSTNYFNVNDLLRSIVMRSTDEYVCLSVTLCVSVCPRRYLRNHMRDLYQIFVRVACVRGSVFLRHVYDRPHRLSPGMVFLSHWKCSIGQERGWECTARAKYPIYDCLVYILIRTVVIAFRSAIHSKIAVKTISRRRKTMFGKR